MGIMAAAAAAWRKTSAAKTISMADSSISARIYQRKASAAAAAAYHGMAKASSEASMAYGMAKKNNQHGV